MAKKRDESSQLRKTANNTNWGSVSKVHSAFGNGGSPKKKQYPSTTGRRVRKD
jgi:hypothetical protein